MRELESSLQTFGESLFKAQLARATAAPYLVGWVRRFLARPASDETLADQVRRFCDDLAATGVVDWQVRQAGQALRLYLVNFLKRTSNCSRRGATLRHVESIEIHDLVPRGHEVADELLPRVGARVDLREGAEL